MHIRSPKKTWRSPKTWLPAAAVTVACALFASHAFAGDCDDDQEGLVGKAVASVAASKINSLIPGAGKQMISLDTCDVSGAGIQTDFKFNVIGSDGLYWVQGHAKVSGTAVSDIKFTSLSPNLAAASAKSGVKLASN